VSKLKWVVICLILDCARTIASDATIIIVSNTNDSGPGSLRQALVNANDGDTIDATGVSGVITLTGGELLVDKSVTINGAAADVLAIDGNALGRVFFIALGEVVIISGLTIRNGHAGTTGGGIDNENDSSVTIIDCSISGKTATGLVAPASISGHCRSPIVRSAVTRLLFSLVASSISACFRSEAPS
jgi:hypothetical protein